MLKNIKENVTFLIKTEDVTTASLEEIKATALRIERQLNDHYNLRAVYKSQERRSLTIALCCILILLYQTLTHSETGFYFLVGVALYYSFYYKLSHEGLDRASVMILILSKRLSGIKSIIEEREKDLHLNAAETEEGATHHE